MLTREKRKRMRNKPLIRFFILLAAAVLLQALPLVIFQTDGDGTLALYLIYLYAVIPLAAALIPLWAGLGGVHPLAAFFPIGGALLLSPVYHSPLVAVFCFLISLVASVAGQEWKKRQDAEKGGHHGRKAGKKSKR